MSEQTPRDESIVWLYRDGHLCSETTFHREGSTYAFPDQTYWCYASMPEPPDLPEEEKHLCEWQTLGTIFTCKESALKGCWFNLYIHLENRFDCITRVQFCPHCGKEAQ